MSDEEAERRNDVIPIFQWLRFDHDESYYPTVPLRLYPLLRGWKSAELEDLKLGKLEGKDVRSALALLHSWMLLGLLEAIFERRFKTSMFVFDTPSGPVVKTTHLRSLISSWYRYAPKSEDNQGNPSGFKILAPSADIRPFARQKRIISEALREAQTWNHELTYSIRTHSQNILF
jgi:hypothetical protein